jgi:hypothetical protein
MKEELSQNVAMAMQERRRAARTSRPLLVTYRCLTPEEFLRLRATAQASAPYSVGGEITDPAELETRDLLDALDPPPEPALRLFVRQSVETLAHTCGIERAIPAQQQVSLSSAGLAFMTTSPLAASTHVSVRLAAADGKLKVTLLGVVAYCDNPGFACGQGAMSRVGVDFLDLSSTESACLQQLLAMAESGV